MRKLGYLEPRGTFSQEALKTYLSMLRQKAGKAAGEKDIDHIDAEHKDAEYKDVEYKDAGYKDAGYKDAEYKKDIESKDAGHNDIKCISPEYKGIEYNECKEYDEIEEIEECGYITIRDMLFDVESGKIEEAVVPLENSLEGSVNEILDMMANEVNLKYKAEVVVVIRQNLLVKKGTVSENIKYIFSHPQAIGQCRKYISHNFGKAEIKPVYSTAGAAELVASGTGDSAAIGSLVAAEAYGLDIYARDIQDGGSNFTRFAAVSRHDSQKTGYDKTSIVFSTEDKPGSLYKILDIFNLWDINMTRIESRPAKKQLGRYIFFVDIEGHRDDDDVRDALTMIKRKTSFYKFLGSYPRYKL